MNLLSSSDDTANAGVAETTKNGQKIFRAFIRLGATERGVVLEGFGMTELTAIEDVTDKAITFGKLISITLSEAFSTRRMELKQEAIKDLARQLGVDLTDANKAEKPEPMGDN